jgi:hypothetical protein
MSNALTYDLMLETRGILRSSDVRVRLDRDLELGETIDSGAMVARHPGQFNKARCRRRPASDCARAPGGQPITENLFDVALVLIGGALIALAFLAG